VVLSCLLAHDLLAEVPLLPGGEGHALAPVQLVSSPHDPLYGDDQCFYFISLKGL
jgi:hypothetical protein